MLKITKLRADMDFRLIIYFDEPNNLIEFKTPKLRADMVIRLNIYFVEPK